MPDACLTDCHWGSLFTCVCIHMDVEDELCFVCVRGMEGAHHTHTHRRTHRPPLHPPPQPLSPKQILAFVERHMTYDPHTQPNPTQSKTSRQDKNSTTFPFSHPKTDPGLRRAPHDADRPERLRARRLQDRLAADGARGRAGGAVAHPGEPHSGKFLERFVCVVWMCVCAYVTFCTEDPPSAQAEPTCVCV